jgi:23S rRNA pseudouridine2605 synthase
MQNRDNSSKRDSRVGSKPTAKKTTSRGGSGSVKSNSSYSKSGSFGSKKPFESKGKFADDKPSYKKKSFGEDKFSDSPRKPSTRGSFSKDGFDKKPYDKKKSFGEDKFSDGPRKPSARGSFSKDGFDKKPYDKKKSFGEDKFSDSPRKPSARGSFSKDGFDKKPYDKKKSFGEDKFSDSPRKPSTRGSFSKEGFDKKPYDKKKSFGEDKFSDSPRKPSTRGSFSKEGFDKKPYDKKKSFGEDKFADKPKTGNSRSFSKDKPANGRFEKKASALRKGTKPRTEQEEFEEIVRTYQPKPDNITSKETFNKKGISEDAKSFRNKTPMKSAEFKTVRKRQLVEEKNKGVNKKSAEEDLNFGEIRLNRFISNAGICSRREADTLIEAGLVTINGKAITEMGYKVKAGDDIRYNGQRLNVEDKIYILMNKPKDAITTMEDPEGRSTVFDLIEGKLAQRVFAVGRLDRNTTGVLLLTNDGDLAQRLTHPKFEVEKVYVATLNKPLTKNDMWQLASGVELEDGPIRPDAVAYSEEERKDVIGVEIHSGRNRIVHRMFEHMGYLVDKLDRVAYAGLTKSKLKRGEWRELTDKELKMVRKAAKLG